MIFAALFMYPGEETEPTLPPNRITCRLKAAATVVEGTAESVTRRYAANPGPAPRVCRHTLIPCPPAGEGVPLLSKPRRLRTGHRAKHMKEGGNG
jgi:hypothetical protein